MMLILLLVFVVLFFLFMVLPFWKARYFKATIALIGAIICGGMLVANDSYHYQMKAASTTTTQTMHSTLPKMNALMYQPLGNGSEKIYLYKTKPSQKKPTACKTDHLITKVKRTTAKKATVTITEENYIYKNSFSKFMFGLLNNNHILKERRYTFNLPKDWMVLSTQQAKKLQSIMKNPKAQLSMQTKVKQIVGQRVAQSVKENRMLSPQDQQNMLKKVQKEVLADFIKYNLK